MSQDPKEYATQAVQDHQDSSQINRPAPPTVQAQALKSESFKKIKDETFELLNPIPPTDPDDVIDEDEPPPTDPGDFIYGDEPPPTDPGEYQLQSGELIYLVPPTEPHLNPSELQSISFSLSSELTSPKQTKFQHEHVWQKLDLFRFSIWSFLYQKWGTFLLFTLLISIYALTTGQSPHESINISEAIQWGANFAPKTNALSPEWWRLLSAPYLHWDLSHIVFNLGALLLLALNIEHLVGSFALFSLFTASSSLAGLATIIFYPSQISMGASGGVYGIFGALLTLLFLMRGERIKKSRSIIFALTIWLFYSLAINVNSVHIDNASHFVGILSGLLLGVFVAPLYNQKKLSLKSRLLFNALPLIFALITIRLSWSFLPLTQSTFELLNQYSSTAPNLRQNIEKFKQLQPLEQRAFWESEIKSKLLSLEHKLNESLQHQRNLSQSEIKTITQATQWSLKRLLNAWWHFYAHNFEEAPTNLQFEQGSTLPDLIAIELYELLFTKQKISQLTESTWDERIEAIRYYSSWAQLPNARNQLSLICEQLVNEASSAEVRASGSLWKQAHVRLTRLDLMYSALTRSNGGFSKDVVTLAQIHWLKGSIDKVIEVSLTSLKAHSLFQTELKPLDQIKLADLAYKSFLASNLTSPTSQIQIKQVDSNKLSIKGEMPRRGRLFLTAKRCPVRSKTKEEEKTGPTQTQSQTYLIEIISPAADLDSDGVLLSPLSPQKEKNSRKTRQ